MPQLFNKSLFWDVSQVDEKKNGRFIIERILSFGNENDFKQAIKLYGRNRIAEVVIKSRNLDKKSQSFWCQYFQLSNKCSSNQSAKKPGLFWKR